MILKFIRRRWRRFYSWNLRRRICNLERQISFDHYEESMAHRFGWEFEGITRYEKRRNKLIELRRKARELSRGKSR